MQCFKFLEPVRQHLNFIIIDALRRMIEQFIRASQLFASRSLIENVYLHLPFCRKKCHFCAFPIHAVGLHPQQPIIQSYLQALKTEIRLSKSHAKMVDPLKSIYFGGGTPSLHTKAHILTLLQDFSYDGSTEITVQVNPTQISSIKDYLEAGVNRISLGLQSFNTAALNKLGRHTDDSSRQAIQDKLLQCRPNNLSVDFILNLCIEKKDWKEMLMFIEQVLPEHLTVYFLEVNQGSLIHARPQIISHLPQEQSVIARFLELCEILAGLGYDHYQVSNFSRGKKYRSVHSSIYWQGNREYLAYGMGATSLITGKRVTRPRTINKYMRYVEELKDGAVSVSSLDIAREESAKDVLTSVIMSGIRTTEGISWTKIRKIGESEELQERLAQCILEIDQERPGVFNVEDMSNCISLLSPLGLLLGDEIGFRLIQALDKE